MCIRDRFNVAFVPSIPSIIIPGIGFRFTVATTVIVSPRIPLISHHIVYLGLVGSMVVSMLVY